ncbi:single-stranded DNA binding protein [Tenacibaculum phage PTm1]|uniref:Single-stranded DNA-binding protein n=1 Tax=Tenacibaculum phage PTm1 TaxID=2547425 RepID=A0A5S9ERI8_9CAUD|nr:single-stranded DNA binding protein [Tenacibaculum phage PTm1]BBI90431.1 single-stranded DNA binding protein [Tenacibaculum phage PTm1]
MSTEMNVIDSMFGVFGQKVEDQQNPAEEQGGGSKIAKFKPDPKKTPKKKWLGVVKFLPNLEDISKPMLSKTTYWLTDPTTNKGVLYESPKSLGKYEDCVVASKYWDWTNSGDARLEKLAKDKLKYNRHNYVLIQIIRDFQDEKNNGKIMLWDLPVKIRKMIDKKRFPADEDIDLGEVAHNPFDPFNGLTMTLKIGLNDFGRVWDDCSWSKDNIPTTMILEGEQKQVILSSDANELRQQQQKALETIVNSGVKLSDVAYQAPSDETITKVQNIMALVSGEPVNAQASQLVAEQKQPVAEQKQPVAEQKQPVAEQKQPVAEQAQTNQTSDDLDDDFMKEVMG